MLMLAELGIGIFAALLLDLSAGSYALMLTACVAHELTTCVDLAYAERRRRIAWYEQWVHGLQQALPWAGLAGMMLLNGDQALALFGLGSATPDWGLRWKDIRVQGLPSATFLFLGVAAVIPVMFLNEARRCWSVHRR